MATAAYEGKMLVVPDPVKSKQDQHGGVLLSGLSSWLAQPAPLNSPGPFAQGGTTMVIAAFPYQSWCTTGQSGGGVFSIEFPLPK